MPERVGQSGTEPVGPPLTGASTAVQQANALTEWKRPDAADVIERNLYTWVYLAVVVLLPFAPAWVGEQFPTEVLEAKAVTLLIAYLLTLPLAVATTLIYLGLARKWFGEGVAPVIWIAVIVVATQAVGFAGSEAAASSVDPIQAPHLHPLLMAFFLAFLAVLGYALIYGFPLFVIGLLVGGIAGYLIDRKMLPRLGLPELS